MIIDDKINGDTFIKLPCDQGELKKVLKLTLGGANDVAKLLSEVQPHTPGPDHNKEKGRWMERGPYKLLATG